MVCIDYIGMNRMEETMKRKLIAMILAVGMAVSLAACGNNNNASIEPKSIPESSESSDQDKTAESFDDDKPSDKEEKNGFSKSTNIEEKFGDLELSVPEYFEKLGEDSESESTYFYAETGEQTVMLQVQAITGFNSDNSGMKQYFDVFMDSIGQTLDKFDYDDPEEIDFAGQKAFLTDITCDMEGISFTAKMATTVDEENSIFYAVMLWQSVDSEYDYFDDFEKILKSAKFSDHTSAESASTPEPTKSAESKTTETPKATPMATENSGQDVPTEYKNALSSAKDYLGFTSFSHSGLMDQLEFEGYSEEACKYAADNCGADWNEQAVETAKDYLDIGGYSHSGLVDQLEFEGFSSEQAQHGADNCGADWNEQAAISAKGYLEMTSFSRAELLDQLEYEGFTAEQAEYGVAAAGL